MAHIADCRQNTKTAAAAADGRGGNGNGGNRFALAAYTDGEVIFHTDMGDMVSLFALSEPVGGGESLTASGWRMYNELARTRPDLIHVLADDWLIPGYVSIFFSILFIAESCMTAQMTAMYINDHYSSTNPNPITVPISKE